MTDYYGVLISVDGQNLTQIEGSRTVKEDSEYSEFIYKTGSQLVCGLYELRRGDAVGIVNVRVYNPQTGKGMWFLEGEWI